MNLLLLLLLLLAVLASCGNAGGAAAEDARELSSPTMKSRRRRATATSAKDAAENERHRVLSTLEAYEIHDFGLHEGSRRMLSVESGEDPHAREFELNVLNRRFSLTLERHTQLFARDYTHTIVKENGETVVEGPTQCHYRAKTKEDPGLNGIVSLCKGTVHATFHHDTDPAKSFSIQPLEPRSNWPDHVVYRHSDVKATGGTCGINEENKHQFRRIAATATTTGDEMDDHHDDDGAHFPHASLSENDDDHVKENSASLRGGDRRRRLTGVGAKVVGVMVVNDHARYEQYLDFTQLHAAQLMAVVATLYTTLPPSASPYTVTIELVKMYTLASKDGWTNSLSSSGAVSAYKLLPNFNSWRATMDPTDPINGADVAHLLSGVPFVSPIIGLAYTGGVCVSDQKSSVVQATGLSDAQISSTSAHEIGHNLGMQHDDVSVPALGNTNCAVEPPGVYYIMDASTGGIAHTTWSPCSAAWLKDHFDNHYVAPLCVEAASNPAWNTTTPICGDGFREGEEECDCPGKVCTGIDSCCDGSTCKLKKIADGFAFDASCSALDSCCEVGLASCVVNTDNTHVCRPAINDCDVEEVCDGVSGRCPPDLQKPTGEDCVSEQWAAPGVCYFKKCRAYTEQCKNYVSSLYGVCPGHGETGGDLSCSELSCTTSSAASAGCATFVSNGSAIKIPVEPGTQCSEGMGCYSGRCVPFDIIPVYNGTAYTGDAAFQSYIASHAPFGGSAGPRLRASSLTGTVSIAIVCASFLLRG